MPEKSASESAQAEVPGVFVPEVSRPFREVQLRLLLKEREDTAARLLELDYVIWAQEECFRSEP